MHSGNTMTPDSPSFVSSVGIAALVLEGRPLWDDQFEVDETSSTADTAAASAAVAVQQQQQAHHRHHQQPLQIDTSTTVAVVATSTPLRIAQSTLSPAASCSSVGTASSTSSSPCPITPISQASCGTGGGSGAGGGGIGASSSSGVSGNVRSIPKALRDETVQHIQRLRQKLMLIRSAPGTSRDAAEEAIALSDGGDGVGGSMLSMDSDDEPDDGYGFGAQAASAYSAHSHLHMQRNGSGFLSSLQSLATNTCLNTTPRAMMRSPGLLQTVDSWSVSVGYIADERRPRSGATAASSACAATPRTPPQANCSSSGRSDSTPGPPATTVAAVSAAATTSKKKMGPHCEEFLKKIGLIKCPLATATVESTAKLPLTPRSSYTRQHKQQPSPTSVPYVEVHRCNAINASCIRWRNEYHKLLNLFNQSEAICIDVYLGPEHEAILLEQWTIQQCDRTNQMTMTLPSLCSAIRSQLYFSQISAWTEQLRTASRATVHNSRLLAVADGLHHRLDVHYRIRSFDNTDSFTTKPTVHNFPDAIVSDTRCVRVSLKSLPRLDAIPSLSVAGSGRRPSSLDSAAATAMASSAAGTASSGVNAEASTSATAATSALSSASPLSIVVPVLRMDEHRHHQHHHQHQQKQQCTETGKHQCSVDFDVNRGSDEMTGTSSSSSDASGPDESPSSSSMPSPLENPLLAHRNRQLQKYRKRLLRRDQKKKTPLAQSSTLTSGAHPVNVNSIVSALVHNTESAVAAIIGDDSVATGQISINSIRPPLYSAMQLDSAGSASTTTTTTTTNAMSVVVTPSITASSAIVRHLYQQQQQCVEMKSIGTQTQQLQQEQSHAYPNCDLCGIEMQFVCWNCDKKLFDRWSSRPASPGQMSISQACGSTTGERLIQSIQRTPSYRQLQLARQRLQQQAEATAMTVATHINYCDQQQPLKLQQINNTCDTRTAAGQSDGRADLNDCRLCKRQKTAHNYSDSSNNGNNNNTLACSNSFNSINNNNSSILQNNNNQHTTTSSFLHARLDNEESMPFASCNSSGGDTSSGLGSHNSSVDESTATTATAALNGSFHRRTMSESLDSTLPDMCAISIDVAHPATESMHSASSEMRQRLNTVSTTAASHLMLPSAVQMSDADMKLYRRAFSEDVLACGCHDDDDDAFRPNGAGTLTDLKRTSNAIDITDNPPTGVKVIAHAATPMSVFKTPTTPGRSTMLPHPLTISTSQQPHELPQSLQMTCSPSSSLSAMSLGSATSPQLTQSQPPPQHLYPTASVYVDRPVPKVNLNKIFSISPSDVTGHISATPCFTFDTVFAAGSSRPTTIGLVRQRPADDDVAGAAAAAAEDDDLGGPIDIVVGTVHKSNSAPSFAGVASSTFTSTSASSAVHQLLSPRFLKMAAIQKRRSRHLSDRSSERSSIGSDELMSDEEFSGGLDNTYMVMLTPNRMVRGVVRKPLPKSYPFGRRALLGSIEESLLQRCFVPTFHVPGFKVLLGASGGFCPTQLTIPSSTSFYELHGQCLSTPYLCEIRMPRKGYSIPRKGTVQATLLNPRGLVVRMFVVPYDLRDMPVMHQTFIRQRVLAFDERIAAHSDGTAATACGLTTGEQMRLLRYAIHLRFQTSRSGRLVLHTDIRMVISRRTDCDTAAAHAKGILEAPNELKVLVVAPDSPKYSPRLDKV